MAIVTITVEEDGNAQFEVSGATGAACKELTRPLEEALGVVTNDVKKPEFYQSVKQSNIATQGGK